MSRAKRCRVDDVSVRGWNCPKCTFKNHIDISCCEMCNTPTCTSGPEDVDCRAVRRRWACGVLVGGVAVNTPPRTVANASHLQAAANVSHPRSQLQTRSGALEVSAKLAREKWLREQEQQVRDKQQLVAMREETRGRDRSYKTRSGALAVSAKLARGKLLREQEQQVRDKQQLVAMREETRGVIADQDSEFQLSLLHDQVKALAKERDDLVARASPLRQDVEAAKNTMENAERRQSRYGENPKLQSEKAEAQRSQEGAQIQLTEILNRLAAIEADQSAKQELLDAYATCCD